MQPGNPIVGGIILRRPAVRSPNYQAGVQGWTINVDGSAEFNQLTVRGTTVVGDVNSAHIVITDSSGIPADLNTYYTGLGLTPVAAILSYLAAGGEYEYRVLLSGSAVAEGLGGRGGATPVVEAWRINDQGAAGSGFILDAASLFTINGAWKVDGVTAGRGFVSGGNVDLTADTAAIGVTETVVLTMPALTFKAGRAYALRLHTTVRSNTAAATCSINIRDTNAAGTLRGGTWRVNTTAAGAAGEIQLHLDHTVGNNTGADITNRVLVLTLTSNSGVNTVLLHAASPTLETWWEVWDIGLVTDHPQAVPL